MRSERLRSRARVLAAGALLSASLAACGGGTDEPVGAVVLANDEVLGGDKDSVLTPAGTLDVVVGDSVDELPEGVAADYEAREAPSDGSFVPVSWDLDATTLPGLATWLVQDHRAPVRLDLVVDGATYPVADLVTTEGQRVRDGALDGPGSAAAYVAVDGAPQSHEAQLWVDYDGLRAQVGEDSPFDQLDLVRDEPPPAAGCRDADPLRRGAITIDLQLQCRIEPWTRSPYVSDLGWAPDNYVWQLVYVRVDGFPNAQLEGPGGVYGTYDVAMTGRPRVTLDGQPPDGVVAGTALRGDPYGVAGGGLLAWTVLEPGLDEPLRLVTRLRLTLDSLTGGEAPSTLDTRVVRRAQVTRS